MECKTVESKGKVARSDGWVVEWGWRRVEGVTVEWGGVWGKKQCFVRQEGWDTQTIHGRIVKKKQI